MPWKGNQIKDLPSQRLFMSDEKGQNQKNPENEKEALTDYREIVTVRSSRKN